MTHDHICFICKLVVLPIFASYAILITGENSSYFKQIHDSVHTIHFFYAILTECETYM